MIRSLLACSAVFAAGCASAPATPLTPEQLIVGVWTCQAGSMTPESVMTLAFDEDGLVNVKIDGESIGQAISLTMKMQSEGTYEISAGRLKGAFNAATIDYLAADDVPVPAEELPQYEKLMLDVSRISIDARISQLDVYHLTLSSSEGRPSLSCIRAGS